MKERGEEGRGVGRRRGEARARMGGGVRAEARRV